MLFRMRIERWAAWCRGRKALLLGVAALGLHLAGEWLVGGGCMYTMQPDGMGIANNAGWHPETPEGLRVYRVLEQLNRVASMPLAALWLGVLIPALWARVVGSARLIFVLTVVAAITWVLMVTQWVLTSLPLWVDLSDPMEPTIWAVDASFVAMEWSRLAMWVSAGLLVAGFPAAGVRWLYTRVKSGPVKVQA